MQLCELRNEFNKSNILMCFNGPCYHGIIEELGIAVRNHLEGENSSKGVLVDVFAVYIELAQNVRNYISLNKINKPEIVSSIMTIGRNEEKYSVSSGNIVLNKDVEKLCSRVNELNDMTYEEVKKNYRKQMRSDVTPGALGAGLGLLDIAKRSTEKMTYTVSDFDETSKFFTLTAHI